MTWIEGPSTNWKTSVGNRVATIQEETSKAILRHVPSQSNPADLISRGIETSTFSPSTRIVEGTTQVITGTIMVAYNRGQQNQTHQCQGILQKIQQLQTSQDQQAHNHPLQTRF